MPVDDVFRLYCVDRGLSISSIAVYGSLLNKLEALGLLADDPEARAVALDSRKLRNSRFNTDALSQQTISRIPTVLRYWLAMNDPEFDPSARTSHAGRPAGRAEGPALSEFVEWMAARHYAPGTIAIYSSLIRSWLAAANDPMDQEALLHVHQLRSPSWKATAVPAWKAFQAFAATQGATLPDLFGTVSLAPLDVLLAIRDMLTATKVPPEEAPLLVWSDLVPVALEPGALRIRRRVTGQQGRFYMGAIRGPALTHAMDLIREWADPEDDEAPVIPEFSGSTKPVAVRRLKRELSRAVAEADHLEKAARTRPAGAIPPVAD